MYRPRIFVAAVATIVLTLLPAGCSALSNIPGIAHQPAKAGESTSGDGGSSATKTPACPGGTATFTQTSSRNILTAACATVVVSGNGISLTGADITHLTLSGNNITAGVATVGDVTISGSNDVLKLTGAGPVTISGDNDTVAAIGSIGDVTVVGSNNTVTTPGKIGTVIKDGQNNRIGAAG